MPQMHATDVMRRPKIKPQTKAWYRKECERLCKEAVTERCNGICEIGKAQKCTIVMHTHHHVIRRSQSTRLLWQPENLLSTCNACHRWWHSNEVEAGAWFASVYGERWSYLTEQKRIKETLHLSWWRELYESLLNEAGI